MNDPFNLIPVLTLAAPTLLVARYILYKVSRRHEAPPKNLNWRDLNNME